MSHGADSNTVQDQLDAVRRVVEEARSMPMSSSCVISRPDLLQAVESLESAVHAALERSSEIVAERDSFVASGRIEAQEIMDTAKEQHEFLVSESAVFREGKRVAGEMSESARAESEELRRETDDYVDERLGNFEITLRKTLEAVTRGRKRLEHRSELSGPREPVGELPLESGIENDG